MSELGVSRRNLICGFVAAGAAGPLVAACGSDSSSGGTTGAGGTGTTTPGGAASTSGGGASAGGIKTSEIPVGGGKIFPDKGYVVTQPEAGEFKAFSASCTHEGTTVSAVQDGVIICPRHGSRFSIGDGSVVQSPASSPLPEKNVTVSGSTLTVS